MMLSMLGRSAGTLLTAGTLVFALVGGAVQARPSDSGGAAISITSALGTSAKPQSAGPDGFTIGVAVHNFTFDPTHIGVKPNRPGFGHYHVYFDHVDAAVPFKNWVLAGATPTLHISLTALSRAGAGPGMHTLYVVLANNDHTVLLPVVSASTVIQVGSPQAAAQISITSPLGTASNPLPAADGRAFSFTVAPDYFTFDPTHIGVKPNRLGFGHYHIYLDSVDAHLPFKNWVLAGATANVRVTLESLGKLGAESGTHTLFVVLANNDHSLVTPLAETSTIIRFGPAVGVDEFNNPARPLYVPLAGKVTLQVHIGGFVLDAHHVGAKSNSAGSGHYHVYVDSFDPAKPFTNYVTLGTGPTIDVTAAALAKLGIHGGVHAIYVVLANNDHSLITPITAANGLVQLGV